MSETAQVCESRGQQPSSQGKGRERHPGGGGVDAQTLRLKENSPGKQWSQEWRKKGGDGTAGSRPGDDGTG